MPDPIEPTATVPEPVQTPAPDDLNVEITPDESINIVDTPAEDEAPVQTPAEEPAKDEAPAWFSAFKEDLDKRFQGVEEKLNSNVAPEPDPVTPESDTTPAPREAPKTMEELDEYVKGIAKSTVEETAQQKQDRETQEQKDAEQKQKQVDEYLDQQVDALVKDGDLPARQGDEKNPYHASLYSYAAFLQTDNLVRVGKVLREYHDQGKVFDLKASGETGKPVFRQIGRGQAGGTAPVGTSSVATEQSKTIDYKTIHGARDLDELIERAGSLLPDEA